MELLRNLNHKFMCTYCAENNTKCNCCNYTATRRNQLLYNSVKNEIKRIQIGSIRDLVINNIDLGR